MPQVEINLFYTIYHEIFYERSNKDKTYGMHHPLHLDGQYTMHFLNQTILKRSVQRTVNHIIFIQ